MASIFKRTGAYRLLAALSACAAVAALVSARGAGAQSQTVDVYQAPSIRGTAQAGQTLTADGGAWRGPTGTQAKYEWWRCPSTSSFNGCREVSDDTTSYRLVNGDVNQFISLVLYAWRDRASDYMTSAPTARVAAATVPTPTPTATPTATPTVAPAATPTPAPTFVATPEPTPVPNLGAVLGASRKNLKYKLLKPFPVVHMAGVLSADGARVTTLTVKAPRGVTITVACGGVGSCPRSRLTKTGSFVHLSAFERNLAAGLWLRVRITRAHYIGKQTLFRIRRGKAPLRTDGCVYPGSRKVRACPRG